MHERFAARIEVGLQKLGRRILRARWPLERSPIERQIGRRLDRNARAASRYVIRVREDPDTPARLRLVWSVPSEWEE